MAGIQNLREDKNNKVYNLLFFTIQYATLAQTYIEF
jgi:hypothetical protein